MLNSVGQRLQQARLSKQLSVEEAARVTRIRPDKLIDIEEDNYSNFPSMSYAKGFLLLYARFLGVDVRDFADTLQAPNPVSSDDYEYLNAAAAGPQPAPVHRAYHPAPGRERRSTILPVIVFAVLAGAIFLAIHLVISWNRLGPSDDTTDKADTSASPAESPAIAAVTPAPVLPTRPPALVAASPVPVPPSAAPMPSAVAAVSPAPPSASPSPAAAFDPTREVRRAEPFFATPPAHAAASPPVLPPIASAPAVSTVLPAATPDPLKQVTIRPIRKTWVSIREDVAGSTPVYEDYLYPEDLPLKLSGHKFWIKVVDPASVEITRDGQPVPVGQDTVEIE
jgi:cytoskeletal protein RodZ